MGRSAQGGLFSDIGLGQKSPVNTVSESREGTVSRTYIHTQEEQQRDNTSHF